MPARKLQLAPAKDYAKGEQSVVVHDVDDDATFCRVYVKRTGKGWTGSDLAKTAVWVRCELSEDDGATWKKWGAFTAPCGVKIHHDTGLPSEESWVMTRLPESFGRKVRVTVDTPLKQLAVDAGLELYTHGPKSLGAAAFLAGDSASSGSGVTSLSTPSFAGTGSDRCLVASASSTDTGDAHPTDVDWDVATPEAFTQRDSVQFGTPNWNSLSIWTLPNQTSATDTVTATWAAAQDETALIASSYTGIDTSDHLRTSANNSGSGSATTVTLTGVQSTDMTVDGVQTTASSITGPGTGQTTIATEVAIGGFGSAGGSYELGEGTMTWTTGSGNWGAVAVALKEAGGAPAQETNYLPLLGVG